jgi:uncharacterized protein YjiK
MPRGRGLGTLILAALAAQAHGQARDCRRLIFPYSLVGDIDQVGFPEPSGVAYHPSRGTLFVVSDEGDVCEMSTAGELLQRNTVGGDLEGVTANPATGLLYVAVEGRDEIRELAPQGLAVVRTFPLERTFLGRTVMREGGQGIEGLAFRPDPRHPHGGTFFVANQAFALDDPEDPSAIFEVELPLAEPAGGTGRILRQTALDVIDLADLHFDVGTGHLLAICDEPNLFLELSCSGEVLHCYTLPGDAQEGFTLDCDANAYIAQDSGGILKYAPRG